MVRIPRGGNSPSLTAHTLMEVIYVVRITTRRKDVIIIRKLKSDDTIIIIDGLII